MGDIPSSGGKNMEFCGRIKVVPGMWWVWLVIVVPS